MEIVANNRKSLTLTIIKINKLINQARKRNVMIEKRNKGSETLQRENNLERE